MGHPKSIRILKNFCSSDNQFFLKFWLPPFSTMRILNPKVGTAPRKFEKSFWTTNRPRHLFLYKNIVISFRGAFVQIQNYSNTVKRENFLKNFAWKIPFLLNMHWNFVSFTNKCSAIKFCKAQLSTANFINFELARCCSNRRKNKRYKQRRQLTKNILLIWTLTQKHIIQILQNKFL